MPNHITSRITIKGTPEQVEEIIERFGTHHKASLNKSYDGNIICRNTNDTQFSVGWFEPHTAIFTRREVEDVVGLPEGWEFEVNDSFNHFPDFNKIIPQPDNIFNGDLGSKEIQMCKEQGRPNWSDWNRENWGTKWNSYSYNKVSWNVFEFDTAWNGVPELIRVMSEKIPDIEIGYMYADEDSGYNTGIYKFKNGEVIEENIPEGGSYLSYEVYFEMNPDRRKDYVLINDRYEYKEEVDEDE